MTDFDFDLTFDETTYAESRASESTSRLAPEGAHEAVVRTAKIVEKERGYMAGYVVLGLRLELLGPDGSPTGISVFDDIQTPWPRPESDKKFSATPILGCGRFLASYGAIDMRPTYSSELKCYVDKDGTTLELSKEESRKLIETWDRQVCEKMAEIVREPEQLQDTVFSVVIRHSEGANGKVYANVKGHCRSLAEAETLFNG